MVKGNWKKLWLGALIVLVAAACSKDPARESKKWDKLQQDAAEYSSTWPNFKTVVDARLVEGKKAMESTKDISDKEKQGEAMAAAADIPGKLVRRLGEVKYKSESVEDSIRKLNSMKLTKSQNKKRKSVIESAREKLGEVRQRMADAKPTNEAEALQSLGKTVGILISAKGAVDRSIKSFKSKS